MKNNHERVRKMFERYQRGQCTPEERHKIHSWLNHYAQNDAKGLDQLVAEFESSDPDPRRIRKWIPYIAAAALLIVGMTWFYPYMFAPALQSDRTQVVENNDVLPGGNRAMLTLSDGSTISLSESHSGIAIQSAGVVYEGEGEQIIGLHNDEVLEMSLATPRGGTYQLTLSDGTIVWLNAASSITYPSRFEGEMRVVQIDGEVYFDVAKNERMPFKVISNGQEINVLGTEFNVDAYDSARGVKTTLIEGSVMVKAEGDTQEGRFLTPGQQSIVMNNKILIKPIDVSLATAWKQGKFHFDNTPLHEMLEQIARWYDVDIVYKNTLQDERFSGLMSRDVSLQTVLEFLRISEIPYKVQGRKLIIN